PCMDRKKASRLPVSHRNGMDSREARLAGKRRAGLAEASSGMGAGAWTGKWRILRQFGFIGHATLPSFVVAPSLFQYHAAVQQAPVAQLDRALPSGGPEGADGKVRGSTSATN